MTRGMRAPFSALESELVERLGELRRGQPFREVTIVVGSREVRLQLADALVQRLGALANVRIVTLAQFAADAVAAAEGKPRTFAPTFVRERLLRRVVAQRAGDLRYFAPVIERPHFARALLATFDDFRQAGMQPRPGCVRARAAARGADLELLYREYCAALRRYGLDDTASIMLAAARAGQGGAPADGPADPPPAGRIEVPAATIIYGLYDLNGAQEALVRAALANGAEALTPVATAWQASAASASAAPVLPVPPEPATDRERVAAALRLAAEVRGGVAELRGMSEALGGVGESQGTAEVRGSVFVSGNAAAEPRSGAAAVGAEEASRALELRGDGSVAIVSAAHRRAETDEAVREILRSCLGESLAPPVGALECAVVVPGAGDIEETARALIAAGLPVAASLPKHDRATKALAALLACLAPPGGEPFAREATLELVTALGAPAADDAVAVGELGERDRDAEAERALWRDEARRAGVVAGIDDWVELLRGRRYSLLIRLEEANDGDDEDASPAADLTSRLAALERLLPVLERLRGAVHRLPRSAATWRVWARALDECLRAALETSADDERETALAPLAALTVLDERVSLAEVGAVLREQIALVGERLGRVGRSGVAVVTPQGLRGLRFHTVVVTGLSEGAFNTATWPDPLFADGDRALTAAALGVRLPLASEREAEARTLFALAAEAASARLVLTLARSDPTNGRALLPSPLMLDLAARAVGRPVGFDEFRSGAPFAAVWRRAAAPGSRDGGESVWLDVRERDIAELARPGAGDEFARSMGGAEVDRLLGAVVGDREQAARRLAQRAAARRRAEGAYHGHLGSAAGAVLRARGPFTTEISPTSLERYISCPFDYLLRHVYGLDVPDEPLRTLEIDPLEFGKLVHEILRRTYAAVAARDLDLGGALDALEEAWEAACAAAEAKGLTGAELGWPARRQELLEDLRESLRRDPVFTAADGRPAVLEWSFGERHESPLALTMADGRPVAFRGRVDRVDATLAGARVIDYKTGAGARERERIKLGMSVQLPVYALAVRAAGAASSAAGGSTAAPPPTALRAEAVAGADDAAQPGRLPQDLSAEAIDCRYRFVTRRGEFADEPLPASADREGELAALVAQLRELIEGGVFPRAAGSAIACSYCDLGYACGGRSWAQRLKRARPDLEDLTAWCAAGDTLPEAENGEEDDDAG